MKKIIILICGKINNRCRRKRRLVLIFPAPANGGRMRKVIYSGHPQRNDKNTRERVKGQPDWMREG